MWFVIFLELWLDNVESGNVRRQVTPHTREATINFAANRLLHRLRAPIGSEHKGMSNLLLEYPVRAAHKEKATFDEQ